jgi:hypothetical protein
MRNLGLGVKALLLPAVLALGGCDDGRDGAEPAPSNEPGATGGSGAGTSGGSTSGGSVSTSSGGQGNAAGNTPQGGSSTTGGAGAGAGGGAGSGTPPIAPGTNLSIPARGQVLNAEALVDQLENYDPGSLLRCDVADDPAYRAAIDALGGVTWGYAIGVLEDQSKPRYQAGVQKFIPQPPEATAGGDGNGRAVEIVKADIVAVTNAAALFYSPVHGLMIVGLEGGTPEFHCAAQLPGQIDQFYFHQGQLVVMTKSQNRLDSQLLHFEVEGTELRYVESVSLGNVNVLDSRRFNDKLVFYTSFNPDAPTPEQTPAPSGPAPIAPSPQPASSQQHRALRVFELGDQLTEELYDTLIDDSQSEAELAQGVTRDTPLGSQIAEYRSFGGSMWASDHYFVVTEQISKTYLQDWATNTYQVCTKSHTTESPYRYCWTEYETRPNPDYVEPDNSGGDRACQGTTLSACLVQVARVSNKTIQVPVGQKCEDRIHTRWICDAYEQRSTEYPRFRNEASTKLFIYEYTDEGFVRVDSSVHEVTNTGLDAVSPDAQVEVITTSTETYDLAVPGSIQTLYFQNGYLYVISRGILQVYAMGGGSIVRTSTLKVVNESLQASLFSGEQLFLSDFGWSGSDHSTLRVINLSNPAFPTQDGATHQLPGGHRSILAADAGIFTVGTVQQFMGQTVNALKLGLFSNPYAEETAYLILGTDLKYNWLQSEESQFFNGGSQRLLLPYTGQDELGLQRQRVGVSRVIPGSIVSEGAVVIPEPAQRVRPLPTDTESYLTFASNSIEWLTPEADEWKAEPVLEYFEPFAVYRLSKDHDYVELQRLGARCRLFFTDSADINHRDEPSAYSEEFTCPNSYAQAYDRRLVFSAQVGVEFTDDGAVRPLDAAEITSTYEQIAARPYCLLKLELVDDIRLDLDDLPPADEFTCLSPADYYKLQSELQMVRP